MKVFASFVAGGKPIWVGRFGRRENQNEKSATCGRTYLRSLQKRVWWTDQEVIRGILHHEGNMKNWVG